MTVDQPDLDEIIVDHSDWWLNFDSVNFSPFYYTINFYLVVSTDCGLDKQNGYIKLHEELSFWLNLSTILSSKALHTCLFAVNVSKNNSTKEFLKLISLVA